MKNSSDSPALTELEGAVLAALAQEGPCTPYALKEMFRASPSEFWSGSTGAIYPLVRRLEAAGLARGTDDAQGARARRLLVITDAGRAALRAWIADAARAARFGFDPLRTRLLFLELLPAKERRAFLAAVRAALDEPVARPRSTAALADVMHEAWTEARRAAFETIAAAYEDRPGPAGKGAKKR